MSSEPLLCVGMGEDEEKQRQGIGSGKGNEIMWVSN